MVAKKLITGIDPGNTSTKVSYINEEGTIESFAISTVCAPANEKSDPFSSNTQQKEYSDTERLQVRIHSKSVHSTYYFVGDWARNKEGMLQPDAESSDKHNSELHTVTTLTGLAIAALKVGKTEADLDYSGGLPIEEHKRIDASHVLERYIGTHTISFMDGKYAGKTVTLNIQDGQVHVEGVTSSFGLKYDIRKNKLVARPRANEIGEEFALGDLGAGTTDLALYDVDGLNGYVSTNIQIGTNKYIDAMIQDIFELKEFDAVKELFINNGKDPVMYTNREEFLNDVIIPGVDIIIKGDNPYFKVSWQRVKNLDVTEIVLKRMKEYFDAVYNKLEMFWAEKAPKIETFPLVGGGILFAYYYFKDTKGYMLPETDLLKESPYITSRSYLIANYIRQNS
ncbi:MULTISPECIES: hypothetical protein [unclassified Paenibacillus]|uniref:ParM/StbA family protein n=1 Tax=unclassified Paenibacillus TaxID=185978 RepID=UPI002784B76D|nr:MULTISPECIES: hypothetical protein [unclassified Paenibacillus]MDQ0896277.1 plasmid segregation protein ParM [Paenibacillus sp. V4I7]MDQ0913795.1 plasmid segregation protein ParM [Paenibacillus sp. V4I5]